MILQYNASNYALRCKNYSGKCPYTFVVQIFILGNTPSLPLLQSGRTECDKHLDYHTENFIVLKNDVSILGQ